MYMLDLEKEGEPEIKLATSVGSKKIPEKEISARKFQKNIFYCFMDYAKAFDCVDNTNCGKFFKRWEYQTTLAASCETCMQVKKQQLEPDMERWTGYKLGKEYIKAVYCHLAYLTYMQGSVQFSRSVVSDSLRPHESQHARPPCLSPAPGVHSDSCPLSQ